MGRFIKCIVLAFCILFGRSAAATTPAVCPSEGEERRVCIDAKLAEQALQIQLNSEKIIKECGDTACPAPVAAPVTTPPAAKKSSGPSKTQVAIDGLRVEAATITAEIEQIKNDALTTGGDLDSLGDRVAALEAAAAAPPQVAPPPVVTYDGLEDGPAVPSRWQLSITGLAGGLWLDDPRFSGTSIQGLWTLGGQLAVGPRVTSGWGLQFQVAGALAGSRSTTAGLGFAGFYAGDRARLGGQVGFAHADLVGSGNGRVAMKSNGLELSGFAQISVAKKFFVAGQAGIQAAWVVDGNGGVARAIPAVAGGVGYRF